MKRVIKPYHLMAMLLALSVLIPLMFLLVMKPPQGMETVEETVHSAVFSQDGSNLLVGGTTTAWLQDPLSGKIIHQWGGHTIGISTVAISGNNRHAVTGDKNGLFQTWDIQSGKRLNKIQLQTYKEGHAANQNLNSEPVATLSQDGKLLLLRSGHGEVKVINIDTEIETKITTEKSVNDIITLAIHPNNNQIYTLHKVGKALIEWDISNPNNTRKFNFKGLIKSLALSPDGKHLFAGSNTAELFIIDTESFAISDTLASNDSIEHIHIAPDGDYITINTAAPIQTTYTFPALNFVQGCYRHTIPLEAMSVNWGENMLLSFNANGATFAHDLWSGKPLWRQDHFVESNPNDPDLKRITIDELSQQPKINEVDIRLASILDTPIGQQIEWDNIPFSEALLFIENNLNLPLNISPGIKLNMPIRGQISFDSILMILFNYSDIPYVIHEDGLVEFNHNLTLDEIQSMKVSALDHLVFHFEERFDCYDYHHLFSLLQSQHKFDYTIVKDVREPVTFVAENPTPKDLLNATLQPNGFMYKLIGDQVDITRANRKHYYDFLIEKTSWQDHNPTKESILAGLKALESITPDLKTDFTPEQFTAWIQNEHKPFQTTHHIYAQISNAKKDDIHWYEERNTALRKQQAFYQNVLSLWNSEYMNKEMTIDEAVKLLSSNDYQNNTPYMQYLNAFRQVQSELTMYSRDSINNARVESVTTYISVNHPRRRIDKELLLSGHPNVPPFSIESVVIANEHPSSLINRGRGINLQGLRYGSDWDYFFQLGYYVDHIDHDNRQIYIKNSDRNAQESYYVFTLHPENQAYWERFQIQTGGRVRYEIICSGFHTIDEMFVPSTVTEKWINNEKVYNTKVFTLISAEVRDSFAENVFINMNGKPGSITK